MVLQIWWECKQEYFKGTFSVSFSSWVKSCGFIVSETIQPEKLAGGYIIPRHDTITCYQGPCLPGERCSRHSCREDLGRLSEWAGQRLWFSQKRDWKKWRKGGINHIQHVYPPEVDCVLICLPWLFQAITFNLLAIHWNASKALQVAALIRQSWGHLEQDRVLESVLVLKCFSERRKE